MVLMRSMPQLQCMLSSRRKRLADLLLHPVLPAPGRGVVARAAERDVVGGEGAGPSDGAEGAREGLSFAVGQRVWVLPRVDVALHADLLRHPVVRARGE